MSFPRYPKYKDSGVEWLGEVPAHWSLAALSYRYQVALGKMLDAKQITGDHLAPYLRNADVQWGRINTTDLPEMDFTSDDRDRFSLRPGDLLVCEGGEVGRCAVWEGGLTECYYQKALHRLRPNDTRRDHPRFFQWVLYSACHLGCFAAGESKATIAHLPAETFRRHRFAFPPIVEQQTIAGFIDRETAKLDALVAEQERLIELLQEKRQAVISHAVTKGLNPDTRLRESPVACFDDVPAHWRIVQVKHLAKDEPRSFTDGDWIETPYITEEGVRLIQTGNIGIGVYKEQGFRYVSDDTFAQLGCTEVRPRDVLICRLDGPVGRACLAPDLGVRMITSVDNAILKASSDVHPEFVVALFSSKPWLAWLDAICRVGGGFRLRVSRSQLGEQRVPLPPLQEQVAIAQHIAKAAERWDALVGEAERAISLLRERRAALIAAAVTGQIDVRDAAARSAA